MNKLRESHNRQIKISQTALKKISTEEKILIEKNKKTEVKTLNKLK